MRKIIAVVGLALLTLIGCSQQDTQTDTGDRLRVVASFYPMADFTERIGGELVDVETLVGSGTDPHSWEMSTTDRNKVERAQVFIYNGAGFEHWVEDLLGSIENRDLIIVEASKNVELMDYDEDEHDHEDDWHEHEDDGHHHEDDAHEEEEDGHDHENDAHEHEDDDHGHYHGPHDAHTWNSPKNAILSMEVIKDALIQADPENQETYEANFAAQKEAFTALDEEARALFSDVVRRDFIVGHESFGYFARDYGLIQHGIEDAASHGEPDPATMAELVRLAREKGIRTIFYDSLGSDKTARTIAREIDGDVAVLSPLDGRTREEEDAGKGTLEIMRETITALHKALTEK